VLNFFPDSQLLDSRKDSQFARQTESISSGKLPSPLSKGSSTPRSTAGLRSHFPPTSTVLTLCTTTCLRIAYGTFFCTNIIFGITLALPQLRSSGSFVESSSEYLVGFSLAAIFLVSRDLPTGSKLGRNVMIVFWVHNVISLSVASFVFFNRASGSSDSLQELLGVLYLFWVLCGTLALPGCLRQSLIDGVAQ
jgi:hypothetical protein